MKDKRSNKKVEFDDCSSKSQENEMSMNTSYLSDAYDSFLNDIKQAKRRNNFSNTHILLNQNLSNTNDEGKNDKREFFNAHENETEYSGEEKDRMSVEEKQQLELDEKEEDEVSWLLNSEEILEDDEITERELHDVFLISNNIFTTSILVDFIKCLHYVELCKKQGAVLEDTLNVTSKTELANQIHGILNVIGRKNLTLSGNLSAIQEITFSSDHTISNKLQQRMDSFIQTVDAVKYIVSWVMVAWTLITMMTLFVQAIMFRRSWLNNDAYNNVYITSAFIEQVS
ncbi:unnamed protein product [Trichobilharzia regenti]|nr:unnamed protein product [Trichobilharzia regenti]